jgi:alpha-ribazole phosphatase
MAQEENNRLGKDSITKGDSPIFAAQKSGQSPAKRLVLVRHARIIASHVGQMIGSTDLPLDPMAEAQARAMSDRVMRWAPGVCYCSPMQRCRQTAAAVAPQLPPHIDADLREIDFGQWETLTFAEAAAQDPSLVDCWAAFRPDFAFPGGERIGDFLHRVQAATERLIHAEAETVLAIAHGGVIRALLCHLLGLEPRHYVAFSVPYASTVVIDLFDGKGVLVGLERPEPVEGDSSRRLGDQTPTESATGVASYSEIAASEVLHG